MSTMHQKGPVSRPKARDSLVSDALSLALSKPKAARPTGRTKRRAQKVELNLDSD